MNGPKFKILFVGDTPTVSTGFAKCTREVCNRLHANGHEIHILGINEYGGPHDYPYSIYSCVNPLERSYMVCGEQRLPNLVRKINPDVVIILQDPWNIKGYMNELGKQLAYPDTDYPIMIGWLAVDSKNQRAGRELNALDHVVTWTQFGIDELRAGGYRGNHSIIGLGVDTSVFYPVDKIEARRQILGTYLDSANIPIDSYIIGVVGRNQVRKRLDLNLEYYAEWIERYEIDNAYLCLHVGPTGEMGCDIESLCAYYGIKVITLNPPIGGGVSEDEMRAIYSMFDLYWSMSQAEGWNLPALEAMACGVPCLLPEQGAPAEWARDAAYLVPCTSSALTAPLNRGPYTIGGIADKSETIVGLDELYRHEDLRSRLSVIGRELADHLSWDRVGERWEELLQSLWSAKHRPSMTDLMISPESIDEALLGDDIPVIHSRLSDLWPRRGTLEIVSEPE